MTQQTVELHVDPSDETIRLGPLEVRFLLTGDDSTGSVAAFELFIPSGQRLMAPAHSHDHYEETIYGIPECRPGRWTENQSTLGQDRRSASRAAPFTGSTTTEARM